MMVTTECSDQLFLPVVGSLVVVVCACVVCGVGGIITSLYSISISLFPAPLQASVNAPPLIVQLSVLQTDIHTRHCKCTM